MTDHYDKLCSVAGLITANTHKLALNPPLTPDGERKILRHIWAADTCSERPFIPGLSEPKTFLDALSGEYLLTVDPDSPTADEQYMAWSTCQRIRWACALSATRTGSSAHISLVAMHGGDGVWRDPLGWGLPDVDAEAQEILRELRHRLLFSALPMLI